MAMNIKNERVHDLAREAARRTGATQTSALEAALEHYLAHLREQGGQPAAQVRLDAAREIVGQMRAEMTDENRAAMRAELAGMHDEDGLPA